MTSKIWPKKSRTADHHRLKLFHLPVLAGLSLVMVLSAGCKTDEDAIGALGGRAEPYTADTYLLRATFPLAKDDTLRAIAGLEDVVELDLTGSSISDEGLSYLQAMKNLDVVNLTRTSITNKGMEYLKNLGHARPDPPCMMALTLDLTAVTDDGVKTLAAMQNLGALSLNGTGITDASLRYLQGTKSLSGLHLDKTRITDDGLALLAGLELRFLSLRETNVSDRGLRYLHAIKTLQWIDLGRTRVTPEGIKELEKAVPRIEVSQPERH